jgi:hypothetical protein
MTVSDRVRFEEGVVEKLYRVETYGPGHWPSLGEEAWLHLVVGNAISSLTDLSGNNAQLEDYIHRRLKCMCPSACQFEP